MGYSGPQLLVRSFFWNLTEAKKAGKNCRPFSDRKMRYFIDFLFFQKHSFLKQEARDYVLLNLSNHLCSF